MEKKQGQAGELWVKQMHREQKLGAICRKLEERETSIVRITRDGLLINI
jgi:hypothetical protein